jgi:hypothetical protein
MNATAWAARAAHATADGRCLGTYSWPLGVGTPRGSGVTTPPADEKYDGVAATPRLRALAAAEEEEEGDADDADKPMALRS